MNKFFSTGVLVAVAALAVSACSSSEPGPDGTSASGDPIVIGAQAPLLGATAYPQSGYGLEAAEYYVNEVLGGIGGRPIDIDVCSGDGSPETSITCANGFVSKQVPLVIDAIDQSMGAGVPILAAAQIPIIGTLAGSFVADQAEYGQAFFFTGPVAFGSLSTLSLLNMMGKKSASLAVNESPTSHAYVDDLILPIAENLDIDVKVQYPPAAGANLNVVAATQIADNPDVAGVISLPEDACTGLFQALRRQGFDGTILTASCAEFIDQLGSDSAGAIMQPRLWVPRASELAPESVQEELSAFEESMNAVGYGAEISSRSLYAFASVANIANILNAAENSNVTAESVTETFKKVANFESFAGPSVTCDGNQWPEIATACNGQAIFFEVQESGDLAPVNEEGYIDLDVSLLPSS
ncbi:ABC transporter substrate-binding protein [Rhodococcus sp. P1Y]|uniref:ABC transporter substrate-binding protein n=1 Tax=Rhodococcus sp. P1Y TaxID=1302308 RepID=UPI000EB1E66A|nr:ABC transporter substrate-binding protein [Rhodococcus sp. P1Y]AYJ50367.1 hypothetical protein D8W71_21120 [Rhodococcus sp. P1Y]